jgi:hypothetical protein
MGVSGFLRTKSSMTIAHVLYGAVHHGIILRTDDGAEEKILRPTRGEAAARPMQELLESANGWFL